VPSVTALIPSIMDLLRFISPRRCHRPQTGNWRRTLTASGESFRSRNFRGALTFLPNICELTRV
jgi:hypothetical protein